MDFNNWRWTPIGGTDYEVAARTIGGTWTRFRTRDSDRPVDVRFTLAAGRPRIVGLRFDDGDLVTARQLREVSLPALEAAFGAYLSTTAADLEGLDGLLDVEHEGSAGNALLIEQMRDGYSDWVTTLESAGTSLPQGRGRGAAPPTDEELRGFARVLLTERLSGHRGAVSRTARAVGMHRSTAHRWIDTCVERGFLPSDERDG